jgi:hypothetical protein
MGYRLQIAERHQSLDAPPSVRYLRRDLTQRYLEQRLMWRESLTIGMILDICNAVALRHRATVRLSAGDSLLTFKLGYGGHEVETAIVPDWLGGGEHLKRRCPSCGFEWEPGFQERWSRAHNVIPASYWRDSIPAALKRTVHRRLDAADRAVTRDLLQVATNTKGAAASQRSGKQCPVCEALQHSHSLIERQVQTAILDRDYRDKAVGTKYRKQSRFRPPHALVGHQFWSDVVPEPGLPENAGVVRTMDMRQMVRLTQLTAMRVARALIGRTLELAGERPPTASGRQPRKKSVSCPSRAPALARELAQRPHEFFDALVDEALKRCYPQAAADESAREAGKRTIDHLMDVGYTKLADLSPSDIPSDLERPLKRPRLADLDRAHPDQRPPTYAPWTVARAATHWLSRHRRGAQ